MADIKLCAFADEAGDSLADQIKAMQENGIGLLELRSIDKKNVTKFTNEEVKEYKKQLDDAGIGVWSIGSPIGKVKIEDDFNIDLDLSSIIWLTAAHPKKGETWQPPDADFALRAWLLML